MGILEQLKVYISVILAFSLELIFLSFSLTIFQLFRLEQLLYLRQQSLPHLLVSLKGV